MHLLKYEMRQKQVCFTNCTLKKFSNLKKISILKKIPHFCLYENISLSAEQSDQNINLNLDIMLIYDKTAVYTVFSSNEFPLAKIKVLVILLK